MSLEKNIHKPKKFFISLRNRVIPLTLSLLFISSSVITTPSYSQELNWKKIKQEISLIATRDELKEMKKLSTAKEREDFLRQFWKRGERTRLEP